MPKFEKFVCVRLSLVAESPNKSGFYEIETKNMNAYLEVLEEKEGMLITPPVFESPHFDRSDFLGVLGESYSDGELFRLGDGEMDRDGNACFQSDGNEIVVQNITEVINGDFDPGDSSYYIAVNRDYSEYRWVIADYRGVCYRTAKTPQNKKPAKAKKGKSMKK